MKETMYFEPPLSQEKGDPVYPEIPMLSTGEGERAEKIDLMATTCLKSCLVQAFQSKLCLLPPFPSPVTLHNLLILALNKMRGVYHVIYF